MVYPKMLKTLVVTWLLLAITTSTSSAATINQDGVAGFKNLFHDGIGYSQAVMAKFNDISEEIEELIEAAENAILELTTSSREHYSEQVEFTREALQKYNKAQDELFDTRLVLRELAEKTRHKTRALLILMDGWNEKTSGRIVKAQLKIMEDLVKETLIKLKEAKSKYTKAISTMRQLRLDIAGLKGNVEKFLVELREEETEKAKQVAHQLREKAYSGCAALTVLMIIADIFGCFGACSGAATSTCWITASTANYNLSSAAETTSQNYLDTVETLLEKTQGMIDDFDDLGEIIDGAIGFLEDELKLLTSWKEAAINVQDDIDNWTVDELKSVGPFQDIFKASVTELHNIALEFLNRKSGFFKSV